VVKKVMRNSEHQGEGYHKLLDSKDVAVIQQAAQPHLDGNIDLKL